MPIHHLAYEVKNGPIPEGMVVRHKCDNTRCCNPDHLVVGTQTENVNDSRVRGRLARGEKHPKSILTDELVRRIRLEYKPWDRKNRSMAGLSKRYNIAVSLISDVITRKRWAHVI